MMYNVKMLKNYKLNALDGEIGKVKDFYFDDEHWTIRYLIVDTGDWLTENQVLISPYALTEVNEQEKHISVNLTKAQIEASPEIETNMPVSRQFEEKYYGYYGWPMYWGGEYMWGAHPYIVSDPSKWQEKIQSEGNADVHLRSALAVEGYEIQAEDAEVGHVEDFIIEDTIWAIRYLVIDTNNWLPGKKILLSPLWIDKVSWMEQKVYVKLLKETIQESPEYSGDASLTRAYEASLYSHYKYEGYWLEKSKK